jgi:hypothetical protein
MYPDIHEQEISKEFPVHTIALRSHNPSEMKQVADMTSGTCSFIEDKDKINNIKNAVTLFSDRVIHPSRPVVRITLQADEDVTISSIASGSCTDLISSDKRSGTIDIHSIYPGKQNNFIVYLKVPQGKEKLLTVSARHQIRNTSKELVGTDVVVLRPRRKCLPHEVIIHPKVAAELLRIRLIEGIAIQDQDLSRNRLWLLLEEIKNSHEGHAAPEEILSDLEEEVAEMMDRYGVDTEKMLSALNCHQLQRGSTNKGTVCNIDAFQILEQQRVDERNNLVSVTMYFISIITTFFKRLVDLNLVYLHCYG